MDLQHLKDVALTVAEFPPEEAQETLRAILDGEVDAFVVEGSGGPAVYTLKDAHHPYRLIIERMSEGAVVLGEDGTILYCNHSFANFVGSDKNVLLGHPLEAYVAPEYHCRVDSVLERARSAPAAAEVDLLSNRGALPVYLSASLIDIEDWKSCISLVVTDLTLRRRSEYIAAAERFARSVLDQATEPIIVCDIDGIVTHASLSALSLCTTNPLGHPYDRTFPSPGAAPEVSMVCRGGEERHFLAREAPLIDADGKAIGRIVSLADITDRKRAEQRLRESEDLFRSIFDNNLDAVLLTTPEGAVLAANFQAQRLFGYSEEELCRIGQQGLADATDPRLAAALSQREKDGRFSGELTLVAKGGRKFPAEVSSAVFIGKGGHHMTSMIVRDLSERAQADERLRESQSRLQLALDGAGAGTWDWDITTGNLVWSAKLYELYGVDQATVPPTFAAWESAVHPDDLPALKARLQAFLAGHENDYRDEFRILHPQRGTCWLQVVGTLVRAADGTPLRMYGINFDITNHKEQEAELARRVAERTAELAAANKDLEGFTYAASHDMKGPLGRINSFCSLLTAKFRSQLEGDGLFALDVIQQNAQRLHLLVEDLLAHAQVSQQSPALQPVEATSVVRAILNERAPDIEQGGVEIRLDLPEALVVRGNPLGLAQVMRNLIDNALKYSRQAQPPVIEIGGQLQEAVCRLWVRDNGIGIDPVYHETVFDMFRRLHTYNEYVGNGIGLALVRKAIERMGGRVWVESAPGQGAVFFLELPA